MTIERVSTDQAPQPGGHYSQATSDGNLIFVSGQLPPRGQDGSLGGFASQANEALRSVLAIVEAAGSDRDHVLKVTAYIVGIENWPTFNQQFAAAFGPAKPARAVVPVPELHYGCAIEIEAIAAKI